MTPAELLHFLAARGGQEYAAQLIRPKVTPAKRQRKPPTALDLPHYRLTLRGETVQASGPAGQTRLLSQAAFLDVFGAYHFTGLAPTGHLTDLGPLFGAPDG